MASAFSNILNLLSLGSGRIKENDEFGLEVTEDGIQTTGDRYTQSGLGRFINRVGGKQTADDMNRAFENALMKAEMDMKIQQMQSQAQAQFAQDQARLNNSLIGQRELAAYTRNREATKEDQEFDKQAAEEADQRKFKLAQEAADAELDRLYLKRAAEDGLSPEEAMNPAYRALKLQQIRAELDNATSKSMTDVYNRAALNRQGKLGVNLKGLSGTTPLGAVMGMGAGALNLFQDPDERDARLRLIEAQIGRQQALSQPDPTFAEQMQALQGLGSSRPISGRAGGKNFRFDGDDLILLNERE